MSVEELYKIWRIKYVVRRPQPDMYFDAKIVQQMRADGEQKGVIEVGLTIV